MLKKIVAFTLLLLAFQLSYANFNEQQYEEGEYRLNLNKDYDIANAVKSVTQEKREEVYLRMTSEETFIKISNASNKFASEKVQGKEDIYINIYKLPTTPHSTQYITLQGRYIQPSLRFVFFQLYYQLLLHLIHKVILILFLYFLGKHYSCIYLLV